ncbi:uncharacterized protein CPUR_06189 [Claviceps purpurea 20.1]|uniref:Uncharacterized protein n=1 Tax=Claviceps purpurea (strain 20.1) TaxID=1111077 RepID=M1WH26_CLAP2|nr:uncharacterized protein CPUR_06189 [Claviceps purpurea 20.1]
MGNSVGARLQEHDGRTQPDEPAM